MGWKSSGVVWHGKIPIFNPGLYRLHEIQPLAQSHPKTPHARSMLGMWVPSFSHPSDETNHITKKIIITDLDGSKQSATHSESKGPAASKEVKSTMETSSVRVSFLGGPNLFHQSSLGK
ncbi:hypothetical protein CROQUDRAFT_460786 [Cronartium quercuum f. sp. fusiforme G11]|uniref:Uncharacterized protein n=1 Tax=Cronartium quercuum f. sp. fusiforme G11 TaxID=708437 RepID=A0A9P6N8I2_9BASI|nr:hypothetical protein CROQUDRAFT_460786 [Cronartium quercuum f. sp. fusiforme G11]